MVESLESANIYDRLFELVKRLRGENGCPWDREQTPETIHPHLVEEAYELLEAIESGDTKGICEELGDVLFHIFFLARIFEEVNAFTMEDVVQGIIEKMVRRHPHVFGRTSRVSNADEVRSQWQRIKAQEGKQSGTEVGASFLDGVPKDLPALMRAYRLGQRASKVGFDWSDFTDIIAKVEEELKELREVLEKDIEGPEVSEEFGDVLFSMVNLARSIHVHPETALSRATSKFVRRFKFVEDTLKRQGRSLESASLAEMDEIWEKSKMKPDPFA